MTELRWLSLSMEAVAQPQNEPIGPISERVTNLGKVGGLAGPALVLQAACLGGPIRV